MSSFSPKIIAFMEKYKVASDEVWLLPGGKKHAATHAALERVAAEQHIEFEAPFALQCDENGCFLAAYGVMEGIRIWTTGEATPKNCKNPYYVAMAEKRLKDRLTLKLLGVDDLYSEVDEPENWEEDGGQRAPPAEDAIEKFAMNTITTFVKDPAGAKEFYENNKGMIGNLRKVTKERVLKQLNIIAGRQEEAA